MTNICRLLCITFIIKIAALSFAGAQPTDIQLFNYIT